jgi:hypothetical protein
MSGKFTPIVIGPQEQKEKKHVQESEASTFVLRSVIAR